MRILPIMVTRNFFQCNNIANILFLQHFHHTASNIFYVLSRIVFSKYT